MPEHAANDRQKPASASLGLKRAKSRPVTQPLSASSRRPSRMPSRSRHRPAPRPISRSASLPERRPGRSACLRLRRPRPVRCSSLRLLSSPRISFQLSFQRDTSSCRSAGTKSVLVLPSTLSVTVMRREFPTIVRVTVPPSMRPRRHSVRRRETSALRSSSIFF